MPETTAFDSEPRQPTGEEPPAKAAEARPTAAPVERTERFAPRPRDRYERMDRGERGDRGGREGDRRGGRFRRPRRRVCAFCVDKITHIDYKEHQRLRNFVSDRGKILKSRQTGTCTKHQRALAQAIKRARQIALLPFVAE
jgi:small subunit ribosomal protein S18